MPYINRKKIQPKRQEYRHTNQSAKYYNSQMWKNLRNSYIREHPFCERCEEEGRTTLATQVHHRVEFLTGSDDEERMELLLDVDNLMSVCDECHHFYHKDRKNKPPVGQKN